MYETLPGWRKSTEGISTFEKLPPKAKEYLKFLEQETGARIGMISTGPDRAQTIFVEEFLEQVVQAGSVAAQGNSKKKRASARA